MTERIQDSVSRSIHIKSRIISEKLQELITIDGNDLFEYNTIRRKLILNKYYLDGMSFKSIDSGSVKTKSLTVTGNSIMNGSLTVTNVVANNISGDGSGISALGSINTHFDVSSIEPTLGQSLVWDGTLWSPGVNTLESVGDHTDVDTTTIPPEDGDILIWNQTSNNWIPSSRVTSLNHLSDVDLTSSPTDGQVLLWDSSINAWVSRTNDKTLNDLIDVDTSSIETENYLKYNGTNWIPSSINLDKSISDLIDTDVTTTTPIDSDVLVFDGATNKWVPKDIGPLTTHMDVDTLSSPPVAGQVLTWNGTTWVPESVAPGIWAQNGEKAFYNTGNIGIGTNNPNANFEIWNTTSPVESRITGPIPGGIVKQTFHHGAALLGTVSHNGTDFEIQNNTSGLSRIGGLIVSSGGKVGISTSPTAKFHSYVAGGANEIRQQCDGNYLVFNSYYQNNSRSSWIGHGRTSDISSLHLRNETPTGDIAFSTADVQRMTLKSDGKLGLGINTPSVDLHIQAQSNNTSELRVSSNTTPAIRFYTNAGINNGAIRVDVAEGDFVISKNSASRYLKLCCNNSETDDTSMIFDSNCKVGIGQIPGTERLEVNGNIKGTSFIGELETIGRHSDVDVTTITPSSGSSMSYDGTNWVPGPPTGAIAEGYNNSFGGYAGKYDLNNVFNSPYNDIIWSSANSEWELNIPGTYRFKANGTWTDPNSKQIQFRSSTTVNTPAGNGTLVSFMNTSTSYRQWQIVGEVNITETTYIWVENTAGTGTNYNWSIRIQRIA